jgi:hypothetical protein
VGDGHTIKLKADYWITNMRPEVLRFHAPIPDDATVSFLCSDDHWSWCVDTVHAVFDEVANVVLQIPISRRGNNDFLSYPLTKYGDYSVRSSKDEELLC